MFKHCSVLCFIFYLLICCWFVCLFVVAFFIVPASVTIIENDPIVVLEGRNVTLHCLPLGFPAPNVSWTDFSNYTVEEGSILKFLNISRYGHGSYTCSATNACGSDRKKVDIVVECESVSALNYLVQTTS